ncbi:rhomboid family intramembrane serine protease [Nocardioides litoris]|uniref:rhomboid family intramembrane serine protease n=1 Tax=Nocardioides litoris TaxID=1926648 RepID=UPI001FE2A10F|nr:rhomboid family intramembrane serine protease [Nocardioides litoris]
MSVPAPGAMVCYRHAGREAGIRCQRCDRPICTDCMRDAAVGFQCPSCVNEGARATRQGVATYGGRRSANPALTSYVIIGLNVAVWLAILATGGRTSRLVDQLAISPVGGCFTRTGFTELPSSVCGSFYLPGVADGAYWQLVTNGFTHVQVWHIAANMFSLYILGPQVEAALGRARFLAVYALALLTGSATVYWLTGPGSLTLGASGAIFGLFGAIAVLVHKVGADLRSIAGLLAVNVLITFALPNISWQGHLGGLVGGAAVTAVIVYAPRGTRRSLAQWSAIGGVTALVALAVILRSAVLA